MGAFTVSAQQALLAQQGQGLCYLTSLGGDPHLKRGGGEIMLERCQRDRVIRLDPLHLLLLRAQDLDHLVGITDTQGLGQGADLGAIPVRGAQRRDRVWVYAAQASHQVSQHRPRLDRRQLVSITDEDESGVVSDCFHQPGHHRQRHHRGLVDHDHVVREPVGAIVAEAIAFAPWPKQAMHGLGLELGHSITILGVLEVRRGLINCFLQPSRSLAGRRAQCDLWSDTRLGLDLL